VYGEPDIVRILLSYHITQSKQAVLEEIRILKEKESNLTEKWVMYLRINGWPVGYG